MLNARFGFIPAVVIIFTPTEDKGVIDSFSLTSTKHVNEITETDWKGRNFSDSVWNNTDKLAQEIKQVLIEGELTGKSEADMAAKIVERFEVGMHAARRVVRTESNYCINQAELKGMKDAGFDEYEFISLGEEAEDVCRVCDDLDGQRFKTADAVVGVNCPPMHPFCRCKVTTPQQTEEDIQREIDERIDSWNIPEGMSLDEFIDRVNYGELEQIREAQAEKALTEGQNGDIINYSDFGDEKYESVTDDDINRIPHMDIFDDDELNFAHETASRNLLEEVKRQQELGAIENGTELSIVYSENMKENGEYKIGIKDKVEIDDYSVPYHALHTHPDDRMFSLSDLLNTADRDNMLRLTAQGERGSKYVVIKTSDYDKIGYKTYLDHKSRDIIYSTDNIQFSLDFMSNTSDNSPYSQALKTLDENKKEELRAAVYNKMNEILIGGEWYGVKYKYQETGMAYR